MDLMLIFLSNLVQAELTHLTPQFLAIVMQDYYYRMRNRVLSVDDD